MRRLIALAAVALVLVAPAAAQTRPLHPWTIPGTLRYADAQEPDTLNPILSDMALVGDLSSLTGGYFFTFDDRLQPVPELCTEVPTQQNGGISADGKTLRFKLRKGVVWQDGVPFTSADVAFTVSKFKDPNVNVVQRVAFDLIDRVETPNANTVVFHLKKPLATFLNYYFTPRSTSAVLPKHVLEHVADLNKAPFNALPLGIGPFRYTKWDRGNQIVMEANDRYWRGRPKLDRIIFKIIPDANTALTQLRTHEIDLYVNVPPAQVSQTRAIPGVKTVLVDSTTYGHFDFNMESPLLKDVRVRRALVYAIDKQTMFEKVDHGIGVLDWTPISHLSWAYDKNAPRYPYDLKKAAALLDAAGWKLGADGLRHNGRQTLKLRVVGNTGNPALDTRIAIIQQAWSSIGVGMEYLRYPTPTLFATWGEDGVIAKRRYDMVSYAWVLGPEPDMTNQYTCANISPKGQNYVAYCNRAFDAALERASSSYDRNVRRKALIEAQELLGRDVPMTVITQRQNVYAYNDDLTGFRPGPVMEFWNPQAFAMGPSRGGAPAH